MLWIMSALCVGGWAPHFAFPEDPASNEMMLLRLLHFVFGIIWIGLLYFFNLVWTPTLKKLETGERTKIYPELMSRAMGWFRWSALVTVFVGLRYFSVVLMSDAQAAGNRALVGRWFGYWFLVWFVAYALIYVLQLPFQGIVGNGWVRAIAITIVVGGASWVTLALNSGPEVSNRHLAISIGGGLGLVMLLNTWGVVWRVQKRLIRWMRASTQEGTPMPPATERMMRWGFVTARVSLWLSFPMLFFMGAASHYPFLSTVAR
jgi:uncharacterized membrane protein